LALPLNRRRRRLSWLAALPLRSRRVDAAAAAVRAGNVGAIGWPGEAMRSAVGKLVKAGVSGAAQGDGRSVPVGKQQL
jgi:hypothetical protein